MQHDKQALQHDILTVSDEALVRECQAILQASRSSAPSLPQQRHKAEEPQQPHTHQVAAHASGQEAFEPHRNSMATSAQQPSHRKQHAVQGPATGRKVAEIPPGAFCMVACRNNL